MRRRYRYATDRHGAGAWWLQPGDDTQQGAFATTARPQQGDELPRGDQDIDIGQRVDGPCHALVTLAHTAGANRQCGPIHHAGDARICTVRMQHSVS